MALFPSLREECFLGRASTERAADSITDRRGNKLTTSPRTASRPFEQYIVDRKKKLREPSPDRLLVILRKLPESGTELMILELPGY